MMQQPVAPLDGAEQLIADSQGARGVRLPGWVFQIMSVAEVTDRAHAVEVDRAGAGIHRVGIETKLGGQVLHHFRRAVVGDFQSQSFGKAALHQLAF